MFYREEKEAPGTCWDVLARWEHFVQAAPRANPVMSRRTSSSGVSVSDQRAQGFKEGALLLKMILGAHNSCLRFESCEYMREQRR